MATAVARQSNTTKVSIDLPGSRYDHYFFPAMALAMLTTVFVGFAHTYYLAGVFRAPLPSLIIHLHGRHFPAGFSCSSRRPLLSPQAARTFIAGWVSRAFFWQV